MIFDNQGLIDKSRSIHAQCVFKLPVLYFRMESASTASESEPSAPPPTCRFSISKYRQRSFTTPVSMGSYHRDRYDLEDRREAFITRWRAGLGSKGAKQVKLMMFYVQNYN